MAMSLEIMPKRDANMNYLAARTRRFGTEPKGTMD